MKQPKPINASASTHPDSNNSLRGVSKINVGSTVAPVFRADGGFLEEPGDQALIHASNPFESSSAAAGFIARVPHRLWVELLCYTTASIAIQILCLVAK